MRARYVIGPDASVDATDRGLAYGDGLFETMSVRAGRVERFGLHLDRLRLGCERLSIPYPEPTELSTRVRETVASIGEGHLKLILTRGAGPRGYAPPASPLTTIVLLAGTGGVACMRNLDVAILDQRLGENEKLAGIKHLNRLEQVLGRLELADLGADEGLMLSASGAVIGGTSRNVFAVFGDAVRTPRVDRAGIAGVMRRAVLERCAEIGIDATECLLSPAALADADELFMTNALIGIQSVSRLGEKVYSSQSMASRLRAGMSLPAAEDTDA